MEAAARNEEVPLILPTNGSVKKKFRARKTMTASCRQQLAILKLKSSSKSENTLKDPPIKDVQETGLFCETNFTEQDTSPSKLNKSPSVFPNGLKVSIEVSQVNSGINIGCSYNETWEGITKKSEDASFTHTAHFMVQNIDSAATETHITGLDEVTSATSTEGEVLCESTLQTAERLCEKDGQMECEQADMECSTIPENLNASITVKIIDKDQSLENTSSIDDVTMAEPPNTDSTVAPRNKTESSSCTTDVSNALTCPSDFTPVSNTVEPVHHNNTVVGVCQKKRTCSESSDVPDAKRAKTSHTVLLDEIQCLIDRRIHVLFENTFDQRMQTLMHQANLIRRTGRHTHDIARHLRTIKRLERRLKYAVHLQGQHGTKLTPVSSLPEEPPNPDATPNASTNTPPEEATESPPRPPSALNPTTTCTDLVVLSDNESEQPSNSEPTNSASKKVGSAAMHKIMESIMEHRRRAQTDKPVKAIIDLTDEEQKLDKEIHKAAENVIPNGGLPASSASPKENVSTEKVFGKCSDKKDLPLSNGKEASLSCDANEIKQSVPRSPQTENVNETLAKKLQTSSNPEPAALKPPQKPQLRLAQVQNPKGIALSWNITNVDPSCAPATAYCLYVHQGDPNNPKKLWKKIGEIKALPLPMACTLTQFLEDTTYSFAMRAKDANGRFGPLCDIQSTTLKTISSSKKS
ncbi:activating transcription factor 7-interacting protein 2 [Hyla sarda]|uniref:activating transcription factor 7-interacting protein 2 n=1 Tax=Hyla sarda TaxID=327740 RepID=UPI0024C21EE1|nr:activating transcription factor 7-interacting protein 2 [Hyla sarda]